MITSVVRRRVTGSWHALGACVMNRTEISSKVSQKEWGSCLGAMSKC